MDNILGKRLRNLRQQKQLTQRQLANILNISNTALSQYETGMRIPSDDVKIKLADFFGVSMDYLFGTEKTRPSDEERVTLMLEEDNELRKVVEIFMQFPPEYKEMVRKYVKFLQNSEQQEQQEQEKK